VMAWAYLTPMLFGLCPSTGCKYGSGLLALSSPLSGWVWGSLLRRSHAEGCTPARVWRGARGRSSGKSSCDLFRTPSALYPATLYSSEATVYCSCGMAPRGFLILSFPLVDFWALIVAGCLCFVSVACGILLQLGRVGGGTWASDQWSSADACLSLACSSLPFFLPS